MNLLQIETITNTNPQHLSGKLIGLVSSFAPKVLAAILIWLIGSFLIKWGYKAFQRILETKDFDPSVKSFLLSFLKLGLRLFLFGMIISVLGVETTSVAALMAGLGVAIGSAFNGSLGNFAGGIMIILYKPFKVGEFIEYGTDKGNVTAIGIFNTTILTGDYKTIFLPNGMLSTGVVTNWSRHGFVRVDVPMNLDLAVDIPLAKKTAIEALENHPNILKNPAPEVLISSLNTGAVQISVRPHCSVSDYWTVFNDTHSLVLEAFIKNNIHQAIPKQILISK